MTTRDYRDAHLDGIGMEAAEWLLRLHDNSHQLTDSEPDPSARDAAFLEWICRSPEHLRTYFETRATYCRLGLLKATRKIHIEQLLAERHGILLGSCRSRKDRQPVAAPLLD
jgi:ferric-dicitrate binding protein FerR (iron transport regulator)